MFNSQMSYKWSTSVDVGSFNSWKDKKRISNYLSQSISVFYSVFSVSSVCVCHQISEEPFLRLKTNNIFVKDVEKPWWNKIKTTHQALFDLHQDRTWTQIARISADLSPLSSLVHQSAMRRHSWSYKMENNLTPFAEFQFTDFYLHY